MCLSNQISHLATQWRLTAPFVLMLTLSACGGGGGGGGNAGNSGDSNTTVSASTIVPHFISSSAIADVNGDGKNDLIIASQGDGRVAPQVFLNNGNGTSFTEKRNAIPTQYKAENGSAVDIEAVDINNDGKLDLFLSTVDTTSSSFYKSSQIQLYLGNGDGTFADATDNITNSLLNDGWYDHIHIVDFDGDGFLDFIPSSSGVAGGEVYLNDGAGKFAAVNIERTLLSPSGYAYGSDMVTTLVGWSDYLIADFNHDGKPDVFNTNEGSTLINTSTPGHVSITHKMNSVIGQQQYGVLVDVDGDGIMDLVSSTDISYSTSPTAMVIATKGNGDGTFGSYDTNPVSGLMTTHDDGMLTGQYGLVHGRQFLAADFNGDGKQDVLILDHGYDANPFPGARNWLLMNNGAGALTDTTATSLDLLPGYTHQASIGDLNGDGTLDILLNNVDSCNGTSMTCANEPRFWLNDGTGKLSHYAPTVN